MRDLVFEFFEYLRKLGGLHDAIVERLIWDPIKREMEFYFDDIHSNFEGLPEYPGKQPGMIRLRGIRDTRIDIETSERLRVFEFLAKAGESDVVLILFSPSGKIEMSFYGADYPPSKLTESR